MSAVSISPQSRLDRVLQDHALAALMVLVIMVSSISSAIVAGGAVMIWNLTTEIEDMKRMGEMNLAWDSRLMVVIEKAGIEVPPHPQMEQEE